MSFFSGARTFAGPCDNLNVKPTSATFSTAGGTGLVNVTGGPSCQWVAVSNDSWITVNNITGSPTSRNVNYTVASNPGPTRVGTITVAGQTVTITQSSNIGPTVSISSPANGDTFSAPASVVIVADASDDDAVSSVAFFEGSNLLGTDSTSPFSLTWNSVASGSYSLTAVATDTSSLVATSAAVNITVGAVPTISNIENQQTNEDTATSAIPFTVGDADSDPGTLQVTGSSSDTGLVPNGNIVIGGSGANRTVTITPATNQFGSATITISVSDGVDSASDTFELTVNPVNDVPVISSIADQSTDENTPTGAINFTISDVETSAGDLQLNGSSSNTTLVPDANIVFGGSGGSRNVVVTPAADQDGVTTITITVSDGTDSASETFDLTVNHMNAAPSAQVTAPSNGAQFNNTSCVAISATASDFEGCVSQVEFFAGSTSIAVDSSSPYSASWCSVAPGSYCITATATDCDGGTGTSDPVCITVNGVPLVTITSPANGTSFLSPATVEVTAEASDNDGTITQVEFFAGSTSIGVDSESPYSVVWTNVIPGTYVLVAKATDDSSALIESDSVTIRVVLPAVNGDFTQDGKADLLWRNIRTGENMVWEMDGTNFVKEWVIETVTDVNWFIIGCADFTGDQKQDILWRNYTTGENMLWEMDGMIKIQTFVLPTFGSGNWRIGATGDMDGDKKPDIIWRNIAQGDVMVWFMNGSAFGSSQVFANVPDTNMRVVGADDFNDDGQTDLFWENYSTGELRIWYMDGLTKTQSKFVATVGDPQWRVSAVNDFSGDKKPDLAWRNVSTGANRIWVLNGATKEVNAKLPPKDSGTSWHGWRIVGPQ